MLRFVRWIAVVALILLISVKDLKVKAASTRPTRFGIVEPQDAPEFADSLGVGWGRVRLHWGLIQPQGPNQWINAEITDEEFAREKASGRETVGLLIGIPEWAVDENGLPKGLYLPDGDANNLWAGFVRQAVKRNAGTVDHWIIWNEPDVWDEHHAGFTWAGTEADYLQLLKVAYRIAKAENPNAIIHLAAVSHWWDALYGRELYFDRLLDAIVEDPQAAENNYYFDAATLHLYFNPADVYGLLHEYHDLLTNHGIEKPIWLIETNAAPSSDPSRAVSDPAFHVSMAEQAAYMPQALALATAAGAERIAIYKLIDTPGDIAANPEPFGLVRSDGSLRPGFTTAQVAISHLEYADQVTWTHQGIVSQVVIQELNSVTRLLWSRIPQAQEARLTALADHATLIDMWGNEQEISPEDGSYTIILYGGECQQTTGDYCMIGGPPVYVVEQVEIPINIDALTLEIGAQQIASQAVSLNAMSQSLVLWAAGSTLLGIVAAAGVFLRIRMLHD